MPGVRYSLTVLRGAGRPSLPAEAVVSPQRLGSTKLVLPRCQSGCQSTGQHQTGLWWSGWIQPWP